MLKTLWVRLKQGYRTLLIKEAERLLPERFLGRPLLLSDASQADIKECVSVCPSQAINAAGGDFTLDLGKCLFCGECEKISQSRAVRFSRNYQLAARARKDLVLLGRLSKAEKEIKNDLRHIFGRSLKLRQVSAGGCNACEADINVLNTLSFDLGRFGIQFVASPRHADGIVVTGPVTENMRRALEKTYEAIPSPKLVIAVGACAVSGGLFRNHKEVSQGLDSIFPVDLYIPGCPPHPLTMLEGLLTLKGGKKTP